MYSDNSSFKKKEFKMFNPPIEKKYFVNQILNIQKNLFLKLFYQFFIHNMNMYFCFFLFLLFGNDFFI